MQDFRPGVCFIVKAQLYWGYGRGEQWQARKGGQQQFDERRDRLSHAGGRTVRPWTGTWPRGEVQRFVA